MITVRPDMTLEEARNALRDRVEDGERCPCCSQFAKVYQRKLNARMAQAAIKLYRAGAASKFVHMPTVAGDGCEGGKLRYWGLLVEESIRREDGGRSGWWMLTDHGVNFVRHQALVPKYARIYDGRCLSLAGEMVSISDALGDKFDYKQLMGANAPQLRDIQQPASPASSAHPNRDGSRDLTTPVTNAVPDAAAPGIGDRLFEAEPSAGSHWQEAA